MPMPFSMLRPRASGFNPRGIGSLVYWLDASQPSTLTRSGSEVISWASMVGARVFSHSGVAASAANRPTTTTINGRTAVRFDGVNDFLISNTGDVPPTHRTVFVVSLAESHTSEGCVLYNTGQSGGNYKYSNFGYTGSGVAVWSLRGMDAGALFSITNFLGTSRTTPHITTLRYTQAEIDAGNGNNIIARFNRVAANGGSGTRFEGYTPSVTLGALDGRGADGLFSRHYKGSICEILAYNGLLTSQQINAVEVYLGRKWGAYPFAPPRFDDTDANSYINAVEAADADHLEPAVRTAINDFIIGCKADGIWSAIKSSCILMGARTLSGALTPLVGTAPTNNGPFVSGDYNRKTGLVGNASTKHLNTNFSGTAVPRDNNHQSVYVSVLPSLNSAKTYIGQGNANDAEGAGNWHLTNGGTATAVLTSRNRIGGSITNQVAGGHLHTGFVGHRRNLQAGMDAVIVRSNGTNNSFTTGSTADDSRSNLVYSRGWPGATSLVSDARLAFYSLGNSLDLALLDSRVSTLYTAIGAAIP